MIQEIFIGIHVPTEVLKKSNKLEQKEEEKKESVVVETNNINFAKNYSKEIPEVSADHIYGSTTYLKEFYISSLTDAIYDKLQYRQVYRISNEQRELIETLDRLSLKFMFTSLVSNLSGKTKSQIEEIEKENEKFE